MIKRGLVDVQSLDCCMENQLILKKNLQPNRVFCLGEEQRNQGVGESFPPLIPGAGCPTGITMMKNNDLLNSAVTLGEAPYCHTPF